MEKSVVKEKSFKFAVEIVNICNKLNVKKMESVLTKQLLKSGTSIGANIREALNGESKADFIHKMSIAQKEADETLYWLELLKETNYLTEQEFNYVYSQCLELLKIIRSIIKTSKRRK